MRSPEKNHDPVPVSDAEKHKRFLFEQDPDLLRAASDLATRVNMLPPDPACPETAPRALLVGGFVRDALRGGHPKDADIEVYGVSAKRLESLLDQLFEGRVKKTGQSFEVLKIALRDGLELDVSIPRRESKTGPRHTDFEIAGDPAMSVEEAARRRDFTVNALAADIFTGKIHDFFGGVDDLENRVLRVTDPERFQDDPLRVYRAVQFAGRMNMTVDPESRTLLREMVARGDLDHLPAERVTEEVKKLLVKAEQPSVGFELARDLGIIERYWPELHALIDTPQDPEWHPEGSVWIHTMMVVDAAANLIRQKERELTPEEQTQVMMGALGHDLGKPSKTEFIDGRIRSYGHEEAGVEPVGRMLKRLAFGSDVVEAAKTIARCHMRPNALFRDLEKGTLTDKQYTNGVRRLVREIYPTTWKVLIAACEADSRGRALSRAAEPYYTGVRFARAVIENGLEYEPVKNIVGGKDIFDIAKSLGKTVKGGKWFGELIEAVEHERDEGLIETREDALVRLGDLVREKLSRGALTKNG